MPSEALALVDDEDLDMPMDASERIENKLIEVAREVQQTAILIRNDPLRDSIEELRLQMGGLVATLNHTTSDMQRINGDLKETRDVINGKGGKSMDTRITVLEDNVEGNRERIETLEAKDHVLSVRQELETFREEMKGEIKELKEENKESKKREHGKTWWLITALVGLIVSILTAWGGHVWNAVEKH